MTQNVTGYSGDGKSVGHISQQIEEGLARIEAQIDRAQQTLAKSKGESKESQDA